MMKYNSIPPPDFKIPAKFIFLLLNIGSSLVSVLGNALVMVVLHITPRLKTRSNYFLLLLAGTDVAIGLIAQPMTCLLVIDFLHMSKVCITSDLQGYVCSVLCGASVGMLALIGYDRYLHLSKLNNYNKYMTNRKLKVLVSVIFVCPNFIGCLIFSEDTVEANNCLVLGYVGVCGTILFFYYYKAWKIAKKGMKSTTNSKMKKQWRMTKSMVLIVLVFIVCWFPFSLYLFVRQFYQFMDIDFETKFYPINLKIFYFCLLCGYINSCINPFLYYWRNRNIRLGIQLFLVNKPGRKKRKVNDVRITQMTNCTPAGNVECNSKRSIEIESMKSSFIAMKVDETRTV